MGRKPRAELVGQAICDLRGIGYKVEWPPPPKKYGKNVRILSANGESEVALIQTRSQNSRYHFGIMMEDLPRVDSVVLWLEVGEHAFKIPSSFLQDIHREMKSRGYAQCKETQWRINILLDETKISPQGTYGKIRYCIDQYAVALPEGRYFDPRNVFHGW